MRGFTPRLTATFARRLAADPAVALVERDRVVQLAGTQRSPPSCARTAPTSAPPPAPAATRTPSAGNVHAYITDTGIRIDHTDFDDRASHGWDSVGNNHTAADCNGHGTHVAGTVGSNSQRAAKGVTLVAVRVLDRRGSGKMSQVIAGMDWVTRHAAKRAVANLSPRRRRRPRPGRAGDRRGTGGSSGVHAASDP